MVNIWASPTCFRCWMSVSNPPQLDDSSPHVCWSAPKRIPNWILWVMATTHVVLMCCHNQVLTTCPLFDLETEANLFFSAHEKIEQIFCHISQCVEDNSDCFLPMRTFHNQSSVHKKGVKYSYQPALIIIIIINLI